MFMHKRVLSVFAFTLLLSLSLYAQAPVITSGGTVNAADYSRDLAPGAIISIFGNNLAAVSGGPTSVPLPTTFGGTTVELVVGSSVTALPLFYVSPSQINAELPYGIAVGPAQVRVRTGVGTSTVDNITVVARAPKIFTVDLSGKGAGAITDQGFSVVNQGSPVRPADNIIIWMNSLGETTPPVVAGIPAPGSPLAAPATISGVTVTVGGRPATVTFAGAAPGYSGLYQVNVRAPFLVVTGPQDVQVSVGGATTQAATNLPYRQLGFYKAVLGGKTVSGQTLNGTAALAYRQSDQATWGATGFNSWVHPTAAPPIDSTVAGKAVTLRNGAATVYDNNGIEDRSGASYYNNSGGGQDSQKPGLSNLESMSNYFPLVFAGYIQLSQPTAVTELIGYFDGNGEPPAIWDPANPYVKYRMNIWSNASGAPKETAGYAGDVFSTDTTPGTFSVSATSVSRVSSVVAAATDPLWRVSFKPATAITLPAGEYWFSHDASVRDNPASSSTAAWVTVSELSDIIRMQPQQGSRVKFSFFGREMMYQDSWVLPFAVEVRPDPSPITTNQFAGQQ